MHTVGHPSAATDSSRCPEDFVHRAVGHDPPPTWKLKQLSSQQPGEDRWWPGAGRGAVREMRVDGPDTQPEGEAALWISWTARGSGPDVAADLQRTRRQNGTAVLRCDGGAGWRAAAATTPQWAQETRHSACRPYTRTGFHVPGISVKNKMTDV